MKTNYTLSFGFLYLLFILLPFACETETPEDSTPEEAFSPDLFCPGDPSGICPDEGDGILLAGASLSVVTPVCFEDWNDLDGDGIYEARHGETFNDCGCDRICPGDPDYTSPDADGSEGDGIFQAVWLAGYGMGRAATGIHDDLYIRTLYLQQNETSLAIVAGDFIGIFQDFIWEIREELVDEGVDHVIFNSTHTHEGPDTIGIWGPDLLETGIDFDYMEKLKETIISTILEAKERAVAAVVEFASISLNEFPEKGVGNFVHDSRDPVVIDDTIYVARFIEEGTNETISTLVNWANHPETLEDENTLITSDFVHYVRKSVEEGFVEDGISGTGGICIYISGALGGMMSPGDAVVTGRDGVEYSEASFEKAEALGEVVGEYVLTALESAEEETSPILSFKMKKFYVTVENWVYHVALLNDLFYPRELYNYDPEESLTEGNYPDILTQVNVISLGSAQMICLPGELFPEFAIGGYDGSKTGPLQELIKPENPNPPDLSQAPSPPYLRDLMEGEFKFLFGLSNDELGYIIPSYDYILGEPPYITEAEGDHYEETNSIGPNGAPKIIENLTNLLKWNNQ